MIGARPVRVLVVVLSLEREPWVSLEQVQRSTWMAQIDDVTYVWLRGKANGSGRLCFLLLRRMLERLGLRSWIDRAYGQLSMRRPVSGTMEVVRTETYEYWIGTSAKMRAALPYIVGEYEFDYLVRTNSSTYLHMEMLIRHLQTAPVHRYYAGADQGESHAQGTCIILSRDVVERMSKDTDWDYEEVDDRAVGLSAHRMGLSFEPLPQKVVSDEQDLPASLNWLGNDRFIFRFKNRGRREVDVKMMQMLHLLLRKSDPIRETNKQQVTSVGLDSQLKSPQIPRQ